MSGGQTIDTMQQAERETIRQRALELLRALGYREQSADAPLIDACVAQTLGRLAAAVNLPEGLPLPGGLRPAAALAAAGEVLFLLRGAGRLADFHLEAAVRSVRLGDTDVSFAADETDTPEQRFDRLIGAMRQLNGEELIRYRRVCW